MALEGLAAPRGMLAFVKHARAFDRRETTASLPLELSVEGVFLAARCAEPLLQAGGQRFLKVWQHIEAAVLAAASQGQGPAEVRLNGPEFVAQRLMLGRDRALFAEDLEQAELWRGRVPGSDRTLLGVVARAPRSQLFDVWLANETWLQAEGGSYLLAVQNHKRWTLSSDRRSKLTLQPLLAQLQAAEEAADPKLARADPWVLESTGTLQAPLSGSRLSRSAVLEQLRGWLRAKPLAQWRQTQVDTLLAKWEKTFPVYKKPASQPSRGDTPHFSAFDSRGSPLLLKVHGVYGPAESALQQSGLEIEKLRTIEKLCRKEKVGGRARLLTYRRVRRLEDEHKLFALACPGGTTDLRSWRTARERIGIGEVFSILRDVATALEKLHSWNLCHLDVQPENVLIAKNLARPRALLTNCGCSLGADGSLSRLPDPLFAPPDLRKADASWDVFSFAMLVAFIVRGDCAEPFRDPQDGGAHRDILRPARARLSVDGVEEGWYERLGVLLLEATNEAAHQRLQLNELREAILELPLDAAGTTSEQIIDDIFGDDEEGAELPGSFDPEPSGAIPAYAAAGKMSISEDSLPTLVAAPEELEEVAVATPPAPAATAAAKKQEHESAAGDAEEEEEEEEEKEKEKEKAQEEEIERPPSNTIGKLKRLDQFYGGLIADSDNSASPRKVVKAPRNFAPSPESGDEQDEEAPAQEQAQPMEVSAGRDGGKLKVMTTFEMLDAIQEAAEEGDEDGYPLAPSTTDRREPRKRPSDERSRSERNLRAPDRRRGPRPSGRAGDGATTRLRGSTTGRIPLVPPALPLREGRGRKPTPELPARSAVQRRGREAPSRSEPPAHDRPRKPRPGSKERPVSERARKTKPKPLSSGRSGTPASRQRHGSQRPVSEPSSPARPTTRRLARAEIEAATRKPSRPIHEKPRTSRKAKPKFHRTLGPVGLIKRLGAGGFASVYLGQHLKNNAKVAVKVLNKKAANERVINRFIVEAKLLKKIRSKHLVRVYEIGEADGLHYIVMEYIDGWSCEDLLKIVKDHKRPGLAALSALVIMEAATRGLAELHKLGVVHRDIKPANIMVPRITPDARESQDQRLQNQTIEGIVPPELRQCKLIDLGIAKTEQSNLTATGVGMGTLGYAPPEQLVEAKEVTPASDVFSMGATLYFLLTGRAPFEGKFSEVVGKTLQGKFVPLFMRCPGISRRLDKLVARCLAKHADKRFPDAVALLKAIEETRRSL